eukprot:TRINITY_DN15889_c0_g1_i1.p1 TRINITY_DN15889_c0_g1~~TRINITY_DN15889_c0_g1_i1.p1  ORF type:complete len:447 (+),score=56.92 TRINITY_DN15889_c0_g1_i1:120-1460(+)
MREESAVVHGVSPSKAKGRLPLRAVNTFVVAAILCGIIAGTNGNTHAAEQPCGSTDLMCLVKTSSLEPHHAKCQRRLKVALVGAGAFAKKAHLPSLLIDASDCYELRAVWSRSRESAEDAVAAAVARRGGSNDAHGIARDSLKPRPLWGEDGFKELLSGILDVDVLDLVLPIREQSEFVEAALRHGLSVISEKPIAADLTRAQELLRIAEGAQGRWFVAENWRFEEPFRVAAQAVRLGAVGEVLSFTAVSLSEIPANNSMVRSGSWRIADAGNWIVDVGVHMVAAMQMVLGKNLVVHGVAARATTSHLRPFDTFSAALSLGDQNGPPGTWLFSLASPRTKPKEVSGLSDLELVIVGTIGSISMTRAHVELRNQNGDVLDRVGNLSSSSVALALRAAAHDLLNGPDAHIMEASQAYADLVVVDAISRMGSAKLSHVDSASRSSKVEL